MIKKLAVLLCVLLPLASFAQDSIDEFVYRESKWLKRAGVTSLILGTATTAAGVTVIAVNYKNFNGGNRTGEDGETGGYVVGGLITALGIGVDLLAIPIFKNRREMIENARSSHLIARPNGVSFVTTF
jgi:hypothetical protein